MPFTGIVALDKNVHVISIQGLRLQILKYPEVS